MTNEEYKILDFVTKQIHTGNIDHVCITAKTKEGKEIVLNRINVPLELKEKLKNAKTNPTIK